MLLMFLVPQRHEQKTDSAGAASWNSDDHPAWHPTPLWDLFTGLVIFPQWLDELMQDEYTCHQISRTGQWLCLTLLVFPVLLLLIALDFNPAHWLLLTEMFDLIALFLWAFWFGAAAAVAVVTDHPLLFFLAAMMAFFLGMVVGLAAFLIVEIWLRQCYHWRHPWLGRLNLILLLVLPGIGVLLLSRYAL